MLDWDLPGCNPVAVADRSLHTFGILRNSHLKQRITPPHHSTAAALPPSMMSALTNTSAIKHHQQIKPVLATSLSRTRVTVLAPSQKRFWFAPQLILHVHSVVYIVSTARPHLKFYLRIYVLRVRCTRTLDDHATCTLRTCACSAASWLSTFFPPATAFQEVPSREYS